MNHNLAIAKLDPTINLLVNSDKFGFTSIDDATAATITGGKAGVSVNATATAYGPFTNASTQTETLAVGGKTYSIAVGEGTAIAIGDNPSSNVTVSGTGDIVRKVAKTINLPGESISVGVILAFSRN